MKQVGLFLLPSGLYACTVAVVPPEIILQEPVYTPGWRNHPKLEFSKSQVSLPSRETSVHSWGLVPDHLI